MVDVAKISWPSLTNLLRIVGALFVVASGVIYLLQGLTEANTLLRYWVYLALMFVLSVGGIFSYKSMHDDKGARLFFGLATLLIPIQFTQLGAGFYEWYHPALFDDPQGLLTLMSFVAATVVMSLLSSFGGLSILARPYAVKLTGLFLLSNALLLVPERGVFVQLSIMMMLVLILLWLHGKLFREQHFQSVEGRAVIGIMLLPLTILLARSGFSVSNELGTSVMLLEGAVLMQFSSNLSTRRFAKLIKAVSFALFVIGWSLVVYCLCLGAGSVLALPEEIVLFVWVLPLLSMSVELDMQAQSTKAYRFVGASIFALYGFASWTLFDMFGLLLLSLVATAVMIYSVVCKSKLLLSLSVAYLGLSIVDIVVLSIGSIEVNAWIGFAILGASLVAVSSVVERYGDVFKTALRNSIDRLQTWEY
jgi:hypothetical protein